MSFGDGLAGLIGRNIKNVEESNPYITHKLALIIRDNESFIPSLDLFFL